MLDNESVMTYAFKNKGLFCQAVLIVKYIYNEEAVMKTRTAGVLCFIFLFISVFFTPFGQASAAEKEFFISKIYVIGYTRISTQDLAQITKAYEGKNLTLADLKKVAELITDEYKKRGYILSSAYVPEQNIVNGTAEIAVIEGKIGDVIVQGNHKYYSTDFIKKHFERVKKDNALDQDKLERALLVLNEYPKLNVKATLQPGKEPGTSDLVITADNSIPVQATLDYNNYGSRFIGRNRYGATFDIGNLVKEGALFSLHGVTGDDPSDILFGRASYSIPINNLGSRAGIYYSRGDSDVGGEYAALNMKGKSEAFGMYITHPFIKKASRTLTAEFDFDAKNSKQYLLGDLTSKDYIRSVRGSVTFEDIDLTGRTTTALAVSQGLGHILGGMPNDSDESSRLSGHADNRYTKFNLDLIRLQRVYPFYKGEAFVYAILKASGQWSINSLVANEQFSIGGADSVRGYTESEFMGDHGYAATAEIRVMPLKQKELLQFAFFIDNGGVIVRSPAPGESKQHNLTGGGAGVRMQLPYDIYLKTDVGFPIKPCDNSEDRKPLVYLQALKRF